MGKIEKSAGSVSIIGGSDGPTSIFLAGRSKRSLKQKIKRKFLALRKEWCALWIKPGAHSMEEVVIYAKERYGFSECSKEDGEYLRQYEDLRCSFILMHQPELLGEYASALKLSGAGEIRLQEFQRQWELQKEKAKEISEEEFAIDFHVLQKNTDKGRMELILEGRFGSISGSWSSRGRKRDKSFKRIYRDIYRYYGVTKEDIADKTERYQELVRILA